MHFSRIAMALLPAVVVANLNCAASASSAPQVTAVRFADNGDSTLNVTIKGSGFGSSTKVGSIDLHPNSRSSLPYTIVKWSDGLVRLSGVPVSVDTSMVIEIYNNLTNAETFWGGSYQKFIKID